ncbi:MAG: hypothetical protein G01um101424_360 [Parcubacteria group bacterium Gr01-1014_24]|nr:MAG: hypothetical protein G01um101424_360 [Parcubacteria group bacterium Gr01-1014_24]
MLLAVFAVVLFILPMFEREQTQREAKPPLGGSASKSEGSKKSIPLKAAISKAKKIQIKLIK